jgi:hypothetical protein
MESGMSHQDQKDLRTPLAELKELFEPIAELELDTIPRHGNAQLSLTALAITALMTFGWNQQKTLGARFEVASEAAKRSFATHALAGSYQALMVALRACGNNLCQIIASFLIDRLRTTNSWEFLGRPTFAVDGSQFAVPRTKKNLAKLAAAARKGKAAYKNVADYSKAKTTQVYALLCLHLTTSFPMFWSFGGSSDSERGLLMRLLDRLPPKARLVMDAYYVGYQFWNLLIEREFTFVVRAGKNVDLLGQLGLSGKVKCKGNLVLYWPQTAIDKGGDPIVLSLVEVVVGCKRMFLLTNELTLTENQMAILYAKRWGIEVFFRTVKQSFERAKLLSRTPENAEQELQWTLLGVWMALTEGSKHIPADRRISPVQVLRALSNLVLNVALRSGLKLVLAQELTECMLRDESTRESKKNSDHYPKKKRKKQTGVPTIRKIPKKLLEQAIARIF